MGKSLIQQKRGKGSPTFKATSFKSKGRSRYPSLDKETKTGKIIDLMHSPGHSAPLMKISYGNKEEAIIQAPEHLRINQEIEIGNTTTVQTGNVIPLMNIPEGVPICNIENKPGDGGKFVKSSGGSGKIVSKLKNKIIVLLPSKKEHTFKPACRATIGIIAGSGKKEKPLLKAGTKFHAHKTRNKYYPRVGGTAMNAVSHPFGGSSTKSKGKPQTTSRHAPPGRKVGRIAAKRTGKKR